MLGRVKISTAIYLLVFILLVGYLIERYFALNDNTETKITTIKKVVTQTLINNITTEEIQKKHRPGYYRGGVFVDDENLVPNYPTLIIIENQVSSRPQAGLEGASVVYEVSAEGGITRFLALFDTLDNIDRIGPIRSARPYFLDLAEGYDRAIFLHVGGSPEALRTIKDRDVLDLDEFYWRHDYYKRVQDRKAPHNTYTTPTLIKKIQDNYKLKFATYDPWLYKNEDLIKDRGDIYISEIDFSVYDFDYEEAYMVSWDYDRILNNYIRRQGGKIHETENKSVVNVKNVAVVYASEKRIDNIGRLEIGIMGEGVSEVFQDGNKIEGTWKKPSAGERIKFYDTGGEEIGFNIGQTWIEIVPVQNKVVVKNLD